MQVQTTQENAAPARTKFRIFTMLIALYLSLFVAALDQTVLHSASGYTWIGGAYLLAKAASMPIWAKFSDIWGRKPIILAGLVLFFASSIICALARTMTVLIVGRAIQGVGGGGLLQLVTITISDVFSLRRRSLFLGITEIVWAVAAGVGPVLGGVLAEKVSWRWIFWLNLPITASAFALTLFFLDIHNPRTAVREGLVAVDWLGTLTILGLTLMILLGLNFGGVEAPWSSAKVICLIVFGALMSVFFVYSETKLAVRPIMLMQLFHDTSNVAAFVSSFAHGFVSIALEYYLPLFFQGANLMNPTKSGLMILPLIITEALAAFLTGIVIHHTGDYKHVLSVGLVVMTIGTALFTLFRAQTSIGMIAGLGVLVGAGVGLGFQPPIIAIQARASQNNVATATATVGFLNNMAYSLSIVIGGVVFQNGIAMREEKLIDAGITRDLARLLAGPDAAANIDKIRDITDAGQRLVVKEAFAWGLRNLWIMYACVAGCGALASLFIKRTVLSMDHTETKTGLRKDE
ncbi:uncharacterized protein K452DRAFT_354459 [Aplosporella prunicola CBS 121167]|uniref:Major facilitator superfamily (MFS) profile domain-containing protein n=1 Tax=Aplosporella prunicola CBS 121167 TaxID=1176127 RepID=A0A6A6AT86_9PEZI|nr:uncharacterized protein K452DRAFT_354459 [Aplosporella prunicola CBS 121167]KAF2135222.1 hypothetical protein K452DRAFT_354459 [Aplosporella prunicola CBS 121167]